MSLTLIFPFQCINDAELLGMFNNENKSKFDDDYSNIKFEIFYMCEFLESTCEYIFCGDMINNNCQYYDVEDFLTIAELKADLNNFVTIFCNIRSVSKNLNEFLNDFLIEEKNYCDILCFAETRLTKEIAPLFRVPGYSLFSNPRDTHGGGVAIYVKNVHSPTMLNELSLLEIEVETIGSRLWNSLPSRIREIISYETFKFNVKKLLLLEQNWIFLLYLFSRHLCYILII